ncbi:hypothetical protein FACS189472_15980 [Alphaproteobacteria bacterium]|nr:hypothetical protein FACS189472_15980 [Alphaproteobacteria bacterium]
MGMEGEGRTERPGAGKGRRRKKKKSTVTHLRTVVGKGATELEDVRKLLCGTV